MYNRQKDPVHSSFLEATYQQYRNFMLSIIRKYVGNSVACEDVFHNAFICLIRNEERLHQLNPAKLQTYLLLTARHASIDYLRKEHKANTADLSDDILLDLLAKSPEAQFVSNSPYMVTELYILLRELSAEDQTLLIGHYIVGLSTVELADFLDCSPGALRVKLHRAKKRALDKFTAAGLHLEDFICG